jgi:hypothetical protein
MGAAETGAAVLRLVRALARHGGTVMPEADGALRVPVAAGHVTRTLSFPPDLVRAALSQDLVVAMDGTIGLSAAGRARLARATEPEAPFLAQHLPLERLADGEARVDLAESPLAWLRRRRGRDGAALIEEHAFQAGERLRIDYTRAALMPRVTANWTAAVASGRRGGGEGVAFSDMVIAARQRVSLALDAVGPELAGVLTDVCCFLKGLEQVEAERRWPARSAKIVLGLALERLAAHYGMAPHAIGPDRAAATRFWGASDYRPDRFPDRR